MVICKPLIGLFFLVTQATASENYKQGLDCEQTMSLPQEEEDPQGGLVGASQQGIIDLYHTLPITREEKQKIITLFSTMAENYAFMLLFEKKRLERLGQELLHIHPFRFMGTIFTDPHLTYCMRQIRHNGFKWEGFIYGSGKIPGFAKRIHREVKAKNVEPYIHGFSEDLNVDVHDVRAYLQAGDYEGLVLFLMRSRSHR